MRNGSLLRHIHHHATFFPTFDYSSASSFWSFLKRGWWGRNLLLQPRWLVHRKLNPKSNQKNWTQTSLKSFFLCISEVSATSRKNIEITENLLVEYHVTRGACAIGSTINCVFDHIDVLSYHKTHISTVQVGNNITIVS